MKLQARLQAGEYESPQRFDREMHEFFLKGRRFYEAGSDAYGNVLLLQVGRWHRYIFPRLADHAKAILPSPNLFNPSEWATLQDYDELGLPPCWTWHCQTIERRGRRDI